LSDALETNKRITELENIIIENMKPYLSLPKEQEARIYPNLRIENED
jgi:hypothetical protein